MANLIYRGPAEREPETLNIAVVAGLLPGLFVTKDGVLAASDKGRLFLLGNVRFFEQDLDTAYTAGDTGIFYRLEPEQEYQARMAADTYTDGQTLTVNGIGQLAAATTGDVVVAYLDQTGSAIALNALADVVIANSYVSA